jgi:hypothetical protein
MRLMRKTVWLSFAALTAVLASPDVVFAQAAQPTPSLYDRLAKNGPGGPAPLRDLSGFWTGPAGATVLEPPPMTPLGQARFKQNIPDPFSAQSNDGYKTCDPFGFPRSAITETRGMGFAQIPPDRILILTQFQKIWRVVWMDGRPLPKNVGAKGRPDTRWYGYSVGHWDGDFTLVVESTGLDDRTWIDKRGLPHSADARVEERYKRVDHNTLEVTITIDDPKMYTKPFVVAMNKFRWIPNQEDEEQLCVPSEALEYLKTIADPADQDRVTGQK